MAVGDRVTLGASVSVWQGALPGDERNQDTGKASVNRGVPNPGKRSLSLHTEPDTRCFDLCGTLEHTGLLWPLTWPAVSQRASLLEFERAVLMGAWQQGGVAGLVSRVGRR